MKKIIALLISIFFYTCITAVASIDGVCLETGEPVEIVLGKVQKGEVVMVLTPENGKTDLFMVMEIYNSIITLMGTRENIMTIDLW